VQTTTDHLFGRLRSKAK